ncbi:amidohydrolase family protein [Streptomyces sp. NPDC050704]|uniref:amidohydrolase family protein n=1 Tax=Streptomyces sp. NPDC050704 TaxID=3157219 RepID=UPI00343007D0
MAESTDARGIRPASVGRRSLLAGTVAAAGTAIATGLPATAQAATTAVTEPARFPAGRPLLIRGATVVTMDRVRGILPDTDVLVVDKRIKAVGKRLAAPQATAVIEAKGALLIPGFVDTHRHMWQSTLRGIGVDWTLNDYFGAMQALLPHLRPEDVYAGNHLGMVEAVADGVTTVVDWSHGSSTPAHADAAVDALTAVPGRARWAYGRFGFDTSWVTSGEVERIRAARFSSDDQLVTMQLALDLSSDDFAAAAAVAALRHAGRQSLPVTMHTGIFGLNPDALIAHLADNGFLSPTTTLVHAATLTDDSYRRIADSGAFVSLSAESELNAGQGYPPTGAARRFGIPISLSMDTVVWWSGDMFSAMRATLSAERGLTHLRAHARGEQVTGHDLRAADVLHYATLGGAEALGMADRIGSITPGKLADLVLLRQDTPSMTPVNHPVGHLVFQAGRGDIDTVIVGGRVLKHRGELIGLDLVRARRLAEASRDHFRAAVGETAWQRFVDPPRT